MQGALIQTYPRRKPKADTPLWAEPERQWGKEDEWVQLQKMAEIRQKNNKNEKLDKKTDTLIKQLQIRRILCAWRQSFKYQKDQGLQTAKTE